MKLMTMLFATAALASAPAFAEDLCAIQLQKLDNKETQTITLGSPAKEQVEELTQQAKEAQSAGDTKACISHSAQALQLLDVSNSENGQSSN
nr:hypothetical protein [uncultured Pseudomonas sp.]